MTVAVSQLLFWILHCIAHIFTIYDLFFCMSIFPKFTFWYLIHLSFQFLVSMINCYFNCNWNNVIIRNKTLVLFMNNFVTCMTSVLVNCFRELYVELIGEWYWDKKLSFWKHGNVLCLNVFEYSMDYKLIKIDHWIRCNKDAIDAIIVDWMEVV